MAGPGHYIAFVLLALAALAGGALAGGRAPKKRAAAVLAPFVLAAALYAALKARFEWEVALFPWPWYAFWERQWVYPLGLFILAFGGARLPVRWNRVVVWSLAGTLLAWSLWAGGWMLRRPCPGSEALPVRGGVCRQTTGYNCAPAACATLLAAWGIERSEHEMAEMCLCTPGKGTRGFDIYRGLALAARGSGLGARAVRVRREELGRLVRPFILSTGDHAIVIFELREGALLVGNPFHAEPRWREAEALLAAWDGLVYLLCREGPFDGEDAPHLAAWTSGAGRPPPPP